MIIWAADLIAWRPSGWLLGLSFLVSTVFRILLSSVLDPGGHHESATPLSTRSTLLQINMEVERGPFSACYFLYVGPSMAMGFHSCRGACRLKSLMLVVLALLALAAAGAALTSQEVSTLSSKAK